MLQSAVFRFSYCVESNRSYIYLKSTSLPPCHCINQKPRADAVHMADEQLISAGIHIQYQDTVLCTQDKATHVPEREAGLRNFNAPRRPRSELRLPPQSPVVAWQRAGGSGRQMTPASADAGGCSSRFYDAAGANGNRSRDGDNGGDGGNSPGSFGRVGGEPEHPRPAVAVMSADWAHIADASAEDGAFDAMAANGPYGLESQGRASGSAGRCSPRGEGPAPIAAEENRPGARMPGMVSYGD